MEEKDIIVDEITIDTVGEVETDTLEVADTCDIDALEVGEIVGKALTLNSLNFNPKDGELTYGENVAVYTGKFVYTTTDAPDKEFEIDGSIAFNIKALNNVVLDASEDGKTLEIHLDQAFLTKVDNLDLNKADKADLTALTEIVEQVQLAQGADAIAIVGLQSDVLTIKDTIKNLTTFSVKIVSELPTTDISTTTIYLVAKTDTQNNDYFDEFLYVDGKWEKIGTTKVDFDNHYNKTEIDAKVGEIDADILDLQDQIDGINTDNLVDLETNQEIGGVKIFKIQVGIKNEDGTIDYIKHINNNLIITTSTGINLLNIDEGLSRVYFFNKEIAFKEDIAESSGTTVKVGGVAVAEFDADTKADTSTVEQLGAEVNSLDMMVESLGEDVSQQSTKIDTVDAQLNDLAVQLATNYYDKSATDSKFATKTEVQDLAIQTLASGETFNVWERSAGVYHYSQVGASGVKIYYNSQDLTQYLTLDYGGYIVVSKQEATGATYFITMDAQYRKLYNGVSYAEEEGKADNVSSITYSKVFDTSTASTGTYNFLDDVSNYKLLVWAFYNNNQEYSMEVLPIEEWTAKSPTYPLYLNTSSSGDTRYLLVYPSGTTKFVIKTLSKATLRRVWGVK